MIVLVDWDEENSGGGARGLGLAGGEAAQPRGWLEREADFAKKGAEEKGVKDAENEGPAGRR